MVSADVEAYEKCSNYSYAGSYMIDIIFICILDRNRKPVYVRERYSQGSERFDFALLLNFAGLLEKIVMDIGKEDVNTINIHDTIIYGTKDPISDTNFLVRGGSKMKPNEIARTLIDIKNLFVSIFTGHFHEPPNEKRKILEKFELSLKKVLGDSPDSAISDILSNF